MLLFVVAIPAFGVDIYARTLPAAIVTLLLGAACLASLGVAVASLVKSADQAMPVAQLTFLPISFISGIWFPLDGAPDWLIHVAHFFPLYHIVNAFGSCFVPGSSRERVQRLRPERDGDLDRGRPVRGGAPLPLGAVVSGAHELVQERGRLPDLSAELRGLRR